MSLIKSKPTLLTIIFIFIIHVGPTPSLAETPHIIKFRSPNVYPVMTWDPLAQHFIVGSIHDHTIRSVSDAGVVETLISDPTLPPNATVLGLTVDSLNNRLLAVIHSFEPLPHFNALAAYDLGNRRRRIFLSVFSHDDDDDVTRQVATDVAVDLKGNAYVTNAIGNFIWKVNSNGESWVFSKSPLFTEYHVDKNAPFSEIGLHGIAYVSEGYVLVVQSNTGKMFKVDVEDGSATVVSLTEDLTLVHEIAIRSDGVVVLVLDQEELWFLKSNDSWGEGVVYDEIDLDWEGFANSVVVGGDDRVYVLYGYVLEDKMGNEEDTDEFSIEEVRKKNNVWIFVLVVFVGLSLAYFLCRRFQMKQLVTKLDQKTI